MDNEGKLYLIDYGLAVDAQGRLGQEEVTGSLCFSSFEKHPLFLLFEEKKQVKDSEGQMVEILMDFEDIEDFYEIYKEWNDD